MLAARLRLWFGFDVPVDRRTYVLNGAGLMACKYLMDAAVVGAFTGRLFTPLDYLNPVWTMRQQALRGVPTWAVLALALWTLPFLWVGVGMSMRRALDAGRSARLALPALADGGADGGGGGHQPGARRRGPAAVRRRRGVLPRPRLPVGDPRGYRRRSIRPGDRATQRRAARADRHGGPRRPAAGAGRAARRAGRPRGRDGGGGRRTVGRGVASRRLVPRSAAADRMGVPDRSGRAAARAYRRHRSGGDAPLRLHDRQLHRADHRVGGEPPARVRHHRPGAADARVEPLPGREPSAPGRVLPGDPRRVSAHGASPRPPAAGGADDVRRGYVPAELLDAARRPHRRGDPWAGVAAPQSAG